MLKLKNLRAGYGRRTVLNGISTCFKAGKLISIIGPNGCGKSTLLKAILGILPHTGGTVLLNGTDLGGMRQSEVAKRLAYLPQEKSTPQMTVEQTVLHGRFPHLRYPRIYTDRDRDIANTAMEKMGIAELSEHPLSALSGGIRQATYIAMALAQDTSYILLDEPTTHLDIAHQLETVKLLRRLADEGKGIVAVMHDLPLALTFSDEIAVMREGKLILQAPPKQVYQSGVLENLFDIPIRLSDDGNYAYGYNEYRLPLR